MQTKSPPSFRTNTLTTTTKELKKQLQQQDFVLQPVPWYADAFLLKNKSIRELTETEAYKQGHIYIQNLSSMLPSLILNPQHGETILDITAAPGSKTTHIAALMDNTGKIVANDLSRPRLYKLHANLKMYAVTNTIVANVPGQTIWKTYPEYFDKTLVDVPCSMEGRITLLDPDSYKDWSVRKIKELETKQKYLLRSAISATKVGGTIVYSTCTLAPEENEGVIDWILKKEGDAIALEEITISNLPVLRGLTAWTRPFSKPIVHTARILPSETMEGFFVAKIRKVKSNLDAKYFANQHPK
jgi:tRNA (cytosine49-C5)-methyltransferase